MGHAELPVVHIVDDDQAVRSSLELLAEAQGWDARVFSSAAEYLESRAYLNGGPACLIVDLQMPDIDGAELLETLQYRCCQLPAIVLTAWPDGKLARRARAAGVYRVIAKPFDPHDWVRSVEELLHS